VNIRHLFSQELGVWTESVKRNTHKTFVNRRLELNNVATLGAFS
jgi:hypothetical protein